MNFSPFEANATATRYRVATARHATESPASGSDLYPAPAYVLERSVNVEKYTFEARTQ